MRLGTGNSLRLLLSDRYARRVSLGFAVVTTYVVLFASLVDGRGGDVGALVVTLIFLAALLTAFCLSLRPVVVGHAALLHAIEQLTHDLDASPVLHTEMFRPQSEERRILEDFGTMIARMQQDRRTLLDRELELREKEAQYRSIFEATSDGLIIRTLDGRIVEANPAVCAMHGYTHDEFIALDLDDLVDPAYRETIPHFFQQIRSRGSARTRSVNMCKDGTRIHVEVHGSTVLYRGRPHFLGVVHDITERTEAYAMLEQRVKERTRELSTLLDISQNMASTLRLEPLLDLILEQLRTIVDYRGAAILTLETTGLSLVTYRGPPDAPDVVGARFQVHHTKPLWDVLRTGKPMIIGDVQASDAGAITFRETAGNVMNAFSYARSWMGIPLTVKDRVFGLLAVAHDVPDHYTPDHAKLALAVAQQAAAAIENAKLYEQARDRGTLEERARLARELHDSVTQALFSMTMHARVAEMAVSRQALDPSSPLALSVRQLGELTQGALAEMRALIFELRPGALSEEGLVAAIRKQASALGAREDLRIDVQAPDARLQLEPEVEEHLYRVVQEALHNVIKHAHAANTRIRIQPEPGNRLILEVADNGTGFDPDTVPAGHLGLSTMEERVKYIGGHLSVDSHPHRGTRIRATVPLGRMRTVGTEQGERVGVHVS